MEFELATTIAGVTVYADRALVARHGEVRIEAPGSHTLRVSGLPVAIQRDTFRASGRGPAGTRILGVEQSAEYHAAAPEETLQRVRDEIARLEQNLALLVERQKSIEEERGWLRTLGEQSARSLAWGVARGTARPEDAGAFFSYAAEESQRLAATALEQNRQREDMQRELEARRREYAQLGGGQRPDRIAASVRVEVAEPGVVAIELSYLVRGASWRPRYDARVEVAAARVRLTHEALVSQRTGEDWHQVPLALSTARPAVAVRLPDEPDPWYLDVSEPPPPAPQMMARAAGAIPFARMASSPIAVEAHMQAAPDEALEALGSAASMPAELATADSERSGAAQIFRLPGGGDVPSDGSPHTVSLGVYELPCRLDYVVAPVLAEGAHLRATAANRTGRVLLPGELHVFHAGEAGDEYIGATSLVLTAEEADVSLYLGVDDNITVKRDLIERDTDKGSLLQSGVRRVTLGYRVTLGNRTGAIQRVVLKDRLPVSRHERIKVRVLDIKPQPTSRTRLEQLTWDSQLAPGEERQIEWRLVVETPADAQVRGLP